MFVSNSEFFDLSYRTALFDCKVSDVPRQAPLAAVKRETR